MLNSRAIRRCDQLRRCKVSIDSLTAFAILSRFAMSSLPSVSDAGVYLAHHALLNIGVFNPP